MIFQLFEEGADKPLLLERPHLEKRIGFRFVQFLEFISKDVHDVILERAAPQPQELALGEHYKEAICLGATVPASIRYISSEVGYGLFADADIYPGTFIGEYTGVVRENNDHLTMSDYLYRYPVPDDIGRDFVIDAGSGNLTRFINHSDTPNCQTGYAFCCGLYHLILTAKDPIRAGQQLSFDYGRKYWRLRGKPAPLLDS